jgi:hypothetical protein
LARSHVIGTRRCHPTRLFDGTAKAVNASTASTTAWKRNE